jgi:saccharopine dehydrogenase-like NADP-dependent oxidoreductase
MPDFLSLSNFKLDRSRPQAKAGSKDFDAMRDILLIGAGKIGETIADLLCGTGDYQVTVADRSELQLQKLPRRANLKTLVLDAGKDGALDAALQGRFAVLSAAPYAITGKIATAACKANVHYLDLTEDVATTRLAKSLAEGAQSALIPQCGLAPGFISIVAQDLARRFERLDSVRMRVGALPQFPSNALNYNLTWSTDGLVNEYGNPCEAIVDGALHEVAPLEELEEFSLDGVRYEAFNTSGGLGTLCETLAGQVRQLNYKTVRYPGHRDIMKALMQDLRLGERREVLKDILEKALPATRQDVVLVFVTVSGYRDGQFLQESYANKIYGTQVQGVARSAIQITTAAGICTMLDLLANGTLPQKGFVRQEEVSLATFLSNRFGCAYGGSGPKPASWAA